MHRSRGAAVEVAQGALGCAACTGAGLAGALQWAARGAKAPVAVPCIGLTLTVGAPAFGMALAIVCVTTADDRRQNRARSLARWYVWRGVPHALAAAAAAAWADVERVAEECNTDLHAAALRAAAVYHVPWPLEHLALVYAVERLQEARHVELVAVAHARRRSARRALHAWRAEACDVQASRQLALQRAQASRQQACLRMCLAAWRQAAADARLRAARVAAEQQQAAAAEAEAAAAAAPAVPPAEAAPPAEPLSGNAGVSSAGPSDSAADAAAPSVAAPTEGTVDAESPSAAPKSPRSPGARGTKRSERPCKPKKKKMQKKNRAGDAAPGAGDTERPQTRAQREAAAKEKAALAALAALRRKAEAARATAREAAKVAQEAAAAAEQAERAARSSRGAAARATGRGAEAGAKIASLSAAALAATTPPRRPTSAGRTEARATRPHRPAIIEAAAPNAAAQPLAGASLDASPARRPTSAGRTTACAEPSARMALNFARPFGQGGGDHASQAEELPPGLRLPHALGGASVADALPGWSNTTWQHCAFNALLSGFAAVHEFRDGLEALPESEKGADEVLAALVAALRVYRSFAGTPARYRKRIDLLDLRSALKEKLPLRDQSKDISGYYGVEEVLQEGVGLSQVPLAGLLAGRSVQACLEDPEPSCGCAVCEVAVKFEGQSSDEALAAAMAVPESLELAAANSRSAAAIRCKYRLAALLLHRGEHEVALVRHGAYWCLANDDDVCAAGSSFEGACQMAAKGCWTPALTLYAAQPPDGADRAGTGGPWDDGGLSRGGAAERVPG
ncbi:hypothetical protein WJX81_002610 [Elliptochloris bilobata]|uniref:USP domain-containing protein n=1 Tax=Elliptochloris bilobata TaxID=381761 RepID=A0AAW1RLV3_9CHLO